MIYKVFSCLFFFTIVLNCVLAMLFILPKIIHYFSLKYIKIQCSLPSSNTKHSFQFRVFEFQIIDSSIHVFIIFLNCLNCKRKVINVGEGVYNVCAQKWVDIFWYKLSWLWSILAPVRYIANFFVSVNIIIV